MKGIQVQGKFAFSHPEDKTLGIMGGHFYILSHGGDVVAGEKGTHYFSHAFSPSEQVPGIEFFFTPNKSGFYTLVIENPGDTALWFDLTVSSRWYWDILGY